MGYAALAITDECYLAGIVRAYEASEVNGIPLIIGSQFRFEDGDRVVVLATTQEAYTQLCELIGRARRRSEKGAYSLARTDFNTSISETIALRLPEGEPSRADDKWFAALLRIATWRSRICLPRTAAAGPISHRSRNNLRWATVWCNEFRISRSEGNHLFARVQHSATRAHCRSPDSLPPVKRLFVKGCNGQSQRRAGSRSGRMRRHVCDCAKRGRL